MRFCLLDAVLEHAPERLVGVKNVSAAEEYLADHFPGFPILPGVFMIEALVEAARRLLGDEGRRFVLCGVRALRYGNLVRPGDALRVEVTLERRLDDGLILFKGCGHVLRPGIEAAAPGRMGNETAVSGRFTMRAVRESPVAA